MMGNTCPQRRNQKEEEDEWDNFRKEEQKMYDKVKGMGKTLATRKEVSICMMKIAKEK